MTALSKLKSKMRSLFLVTTGAGVFFAGFNLLKGKDKFYDDFLMPLARKCPPETSHRLAVLGCKYKLFTGPKNEDPSILSTPFFNKQLKNPIGIAAGFDKQGEAIEGLDKIGFGLVEIGSVTPEAQPGNPTPRVFLLDSDQAIINRYGFNSEGHRVVFDRISDLKKGNNFKGILGINLGKNKTSPNALDDYVKGVNLFGPIADYLVINVSSPNTPGLRDLQGKQDLENLLTGVIEARNKLPVNNGVPVFVKIAPDLTKKDIEDISSVVLKGKCKVDGLIVSNTTIDKSKVSDAELAKEAGGLSGAPLKSKSTQLIAQMYAQTKGKIPIIGVGGVFSGSDAFEKIEAGASYVQLYTAFVYHGPPIVTKIKTELADILVEKGYKSVSEVVGKNYKKYLNNN
ncbi:dihydroorotate dehydrogenase (quinone), mitochondrial [Eupeodes corollae]|uniref:dihydroorotate dehydrogenase (quinone), mitochondrial n=1 Tax=Eupeodes corollae TaxID=290404 RepID=UPI002491944F|nr:dihydroorotate dehydrogenase (quinone), mitochondrial [Eupeodes corollae]